MIERIKDKVDVPRNREVVSGSKLEVNEDEKVSAVEATSTAAEGDDSGASEGGAPHVSEQGKQWRRPSIGFLLLAARPGTSGMHGIKAGKKQYNHKCKTGIFSSLPRNGRIVWILNLAEGMADSSLELENFYLLVLKLYVEVVLSHSRRLYFCSCVSIEEDLEEDGTRS